MSVDIKNSPCDCPPGYCAHFVEPAESCVNRLGGEVRTMKCDKHAGYTWHHNGECLRCKAEVP